MTIRTAKLCGLLLAMPLAAVSLPGCDRAGQEREAKQTGFPGQVTAGGGTSGEVMARAASAANTTASMPAGTPGIPQGSGGTTGGAAMGGTSPPGEVSQQQPPQQPPQPPAQQSAPGGGATQEGVRGQSAAGTGSSGTPGVPEGSGGNTSGAAMGGATGGAAASQAAPPASPPGGAPPSVPAQQEKR
ncbi:hypothetical protein GCM10027343_03160 [Noviherbaspirillum agri]